MSIWKLKNLTAQDIITNLDGSNYTIPGSGTLDLLSDVNLDIDHFLSIRGGEDFQTISDLLRIQTGVDASMNPIYERKCQLSGYYYEEAMHLLKYGTFKDKDNLPRVHKTIVSHDLTQKKSWYQKSVHHDFEVMTKKSDLIYSGTNAPWISTTEGFIYQEESVNSSTMMGSGFDYKVMVKINDVSVPMNDYEIDYDEGLIIFGNHMVVGDLDVVKCCYYTPTESEWTMDTDDSKLTRIVKTEVQFSEDIIIENFLQMILVIDHPVFGNDFVAKKWEYRGLRDYLSGSNLGFNVKSFGGTSNSGFTSGIIVLPFNYESPLELPVGLNARVIIKSNDGKALLGSFATVTFYLDEVEL